MKRPYTRNVPEGYISTAAIAEIIGFRQAELSRLQKLEIVPRPTHVVGSRLFFTEAEGDELIAKLKKYVTWRAKNPLKPGIDIKCHWSTLT